MTAETKTAAEKNIPLSEEEIEILAQNLASKTTLSFYCDGCGTIFLKETTSTEDAAEK